MKQEERNLGINPDRQSLQGETDMTRTAGLSPFTSVDANSHPHDLIQFLDIVATTTTYKPKTYEVLQTGLSMGGSILDAGCGVGYDFSALADMVGSTGRVVGVDNSRIMLTEAQKHYQELGLSVVQLHQSDLQALPFSEETFDACRVDRVLQHAESPKRILEELTRVLKSSGILVASEPDWGLWTIYPNGDITSKIIEFKREKNIRNGHIARELPNLLGQLNFASVEVIYVTDIINNLHRFKDFTYLDNFLDKMKKSDAITEGEAQIWLDTLARHYREGTFFSSYTTAIISGRKTK